MLEIITCQQCGSSSFEDAGPYQIECAHCGTKYKKTSEDPAVIISKGANIIIRETAKVEIKGDLEIQAGANLDIQGQVVINDEDDPGEE